MRNRYLDLLRAAAIVRVIVYHLFGWPWLSIVLPAMGVMFALAGSLTAASLDKRGAGNVVTSRLRRLLPPLWLLGLIAVPVMLVLGWTHETDGEIPFSPVKLLLWILPIGDPPGSDKGIDAWEPLWYIRAYLWFVLLSPLMYRAYKKTGWLAVGAPIVLIAVLDKTGFSLPDIADAAMWDFVTFGACWMAGFAHHDGRLAKTPPWLVVSAALVLGGAAMYWLKGHPGEDGYDLNDVTESQALWSLAFVLVVLRWQPPMGWLARIRPLDRAVTLLNGRAVTVYLWHNIAIAAIWPVLTLLTLDDLGRLDPVVDLSTALLLTGVAVLAFGWVEDLAARRRPRLWPTVDAPRRRLADGGGSIAGGSRPGAGESGARHSATPAGRSRSGDAMPHQRAPGQAGVAQADSVIAGRLHAALEEPTEPRPALNGFSIDRPAPVTPDTTSGTAGGMGVGDRPVVEFGLPHGRPAASVGSTAPDTGPTDGRRLPWQARPASGWPDGVTNPSAAGPGPAWPAHPGGGGDHQAYPAPGAETDDGMPRAGRRALPWMGGDGEPR